jgi:hypothetical protein
VVTTAGWLVTTPGWLGMAVTTAGWLGCEVATGNMPVMTPRELVCMVKLVWGKASTDDYEAVRIWFGGDWVPIKTYRLSRRGNGESSRVEDGGTHLDVCC